MKAKSSSIPQYVPPPAPPPPAQADPAFQELKTQAATDKEDAIRDMVTRDSAALMMRYGQRRILSGRAGPGMIGLGTTPAAAGAAGAAGFNPAGGALAAALAGAAPYDKPVVDLIRRSGKTVAAQ